MRAVGIRPIAAAAPRHNVLYIFSCTRKPACQDIGGSIACEAAA